MEPIFVLHLPIAIIPRQFLSHPPTFPADSQPYTVMLYNALATSSSNDANARRTVAVSW